MKDRVAIVTGAARGIGAATAQVLAQKGAKVAVTDIDVELLEQVVATIKQAGGEATAFLCDVSRPEQTDQLVNDVVATYGKVDILVNNAGICPRIPVDEMTEEMFDRMFNINLKPVFFLTRAAANVMKPYKWGRVVNISSTGGRIGAVHNSTVYSGTKGGMLAMTKSLARHYAPYNILINAIAPGAVDTRMFANVAAEARDEYVETVPLRRFAQPIEIAQSIVHLCSEETTWVTGATLDVNGGVVMV
ncbi:MAG: SDR family oxidoreductase [Chloroflexi bacterium]|nr:SDR family oxidoreductase [Chloroflexota bacterium]MCC6891669.1 SDR family oxidoreductase [Anaerolineae bacterium]